MIGALRTSASALAALLALAAPSLCAAEGARSLVDYGPSASNPLPRDLDADANGVAILKFSSGTNEFRLERRDREGAFTAPEIIFPGLEPAFGGARLALGPGSEAFLLVVDPAEPSETQLVRATPSLLPVPIAIFDDFNVLPVDVAATATGEILVLKSAGMNVLVIERLDRDGVPLGPEFALVLPGPPAGQLPRIAGSADGRIYVLGSNLIEDPAPMTVPAIFEVSPTEPARLVAQFDTFAPFDPDPTPLDISVADTGNLEILAQSFLTAGLVITRRNPQGDRVSIEYPVPGAGPAGSGAAGPNGDFFVLSDQFVDLVAGTITPDPALHRLTQTRGLATLAESDPIGGAGFDEIAADPQDGVWLLSSFGASMFASVKLLSPGGVQQGAELFLPLAPPFEGTGLAADGAGTVFTHLLVSGGMDELLISLSPSTPAATLATFVLPGPEPTDLTLDSSGNLALLMRDSSLMQHFVDRRDTSGALLGSDGPLPSGAGPATARIAPGVGGDVFALVDDSTATNREIYRVEIGQAPVPIASFPFSGPRVPVDLSTDAGGNVLVLIQEQLLRQAVVERLDSSGTFLEIAAAAPSAGFGNNGRVENAVDGSLYFLSTSSGGALQRELQRSFDLVDSDLDGILDDGNVSGLTNDAPCSGGNFTGCDDNCTFAANAGQLDSGGVGSPVDPLGLLRDDIGDACQCGDVDATGTVITDDVVDLRLDLADVLPSGDVAQPNFCNVIGPVDPNDGPDANNLPDDCNIADAAVLTRQVFGLDPGIAKACGPAVL